MIDIINYVYIVQFYAISNNHCNVKLGGIYDNIDDAILRIKYLLGEYLVPNINNTVIGANGTYCGWISKIKFGPNDDFNLNSNQPLDAVYIF